MTNTSLTLHTITYLDEIERSPRLKSPHTRRQYKAVLGAFETWRAERPLTKTLVEEYAAELQRAGRSPSTINQSLAVIRWWARRITDLAFEQADSAIAEQVSRQAQRVASVQDVKGSRTPTGRHLDSDEVKALLDACKADSTPKGVRDAALIALAFATLARNAELRSFTLSDITYTAEGADLHIRHGKGDKARTVYLFNGALAALNAWMDVRGVSSGPIFCRIRKGDQIITANPLSYEGTRKILRNRFQQSALSQRTTWHDFRRTGVGLLLDGGTDLVTIQGITGHADPKTVSRYDRRPENRRKDAIRAIETPY